MPGDGETSRIVDAILREVGFNPEVESNREPDRSVARMLASAVLTSTGVVLLVPNVTVLLTPPTEPVGTVLSLLGTVVSTGLVAAGYSLYHSNFTNRNAVRIAVWNVLGLVVLGSVMVGLFAYQSDAGVEIANQAFTIANLLAIGAAAHVITAPASRKRSTKSSPATPRSPNSPTAPG